MQMPERQKIAIIGAGISGLGAALALQAHHDIKVFEAEARAGGHAHSVTIDVDGRKVSVDTGFIVYNEANYPNFTAMLRWAGVKTSASNMSFALSSNEGAFEWCGRDDRPVSGLFAQKSNMFKPGFWVFLRGILQLQKQARADIANDSVGEGSLQTYLTSRGFSRRVIDDYIVPMGAAIWSMTPGETLQFPARSFFAFFENHKLLQWDRPVWRTVTGGSQAYVAALQAKLANQLVLGRRVVRVARQGGGVQIVDGAGHSEQFDRVIFACHAPTALALLADASAQEREILSCFKTSDNHVVLHHDIAQMPKRREAWASWNVVRKQAEAPVAVTYWMNRLQPLATPKPVLVTLNPQSAIDPRQVLAEFSYAHPIYDAVATHAQPLLEQIQNVNRALFCGAWTAYGFHEDGLRSGLTVARKLGGEAPWLI